MANNREANRFETIVVTTDGSPFAWRAVLVGFDLAKSNSSKLIVISVVDTRIFKDFIDSTEAERNRIEKELINNSERTLKQVGVIAYKEGVDCEMILRQGRPHNEVIRIADDVEADLIVLAKGGSHRGDISLMGGTSQRIIEDADCSVLIVK